MVAVFMAVAFFQNPESEETSARHDKLEYYLDEDWTMAFSDSAEKEQVYLPYTGYHQASDTIIFENTLPEEFSNLTLRFTAENAEVRVFLDEEELYQQELESNGTSSEYYVCIPNAVENGGAWGELCIVLTVLDQGRQTVLGNVIVETSDTIVIGLVGSNLADIACCLLIVITAVIMFVLALIRWHTSQPSRGELYLGLFGLAAGVYCFIGTDTMSIFFDMRGAYVVQEYLMLMLPLFLALYFERNLRSIYPGRFAGLLCVVICNAVIQFLLAWLGMGSLKKMADLSTAMVAFVCITGIVSLLQMAKKNSRYQILLPMISVLVLLVGEVAKVTLNSLSMYAYAKEAMLHGMTVFALMLTVLHIFQISREYRLDAEEKIKAAERQNQLLMQAKKDADAARQEALAANEAKGKFLAQMSHEIRTPINAVLGMDEMILRESREQNVREYAMDI